MDSAIELIMMIIVGALALIGSWLGAFFSKRGEIRAVRHDLEHLTQITESIKTDISYKLWLNQSLWTERKNLYLDYTNKLAEMSTIAWEIVQLLESNNPVDIDKDDKLQIKKEKLENLLDQIINLTAPALIFLPKETKDELNRYKSRSEENLKELRETRNQIQHIKNFRKNIDELYQNLIEIASNDLQTR